MVSKIAIDWQLIFEEVAHILFRFHIKRSTIMLIAQNNDKDCMCIFLIEADFFNRLLKEWQIEKQLLYILGLLRLLALDHQKVPNIFKVKNIF